MAGLNIRKQVESSAPVLRGTSYEAATTAGPQASAGFLVPVTDAGVVLSAAAWRRLGGLRAIHDEKDAKVIIPVAYDPKRNIAAQVDAAVKAAAARSSATPVSTSVATSGSRCISPKRDLPPRSRR